jgi:C4-dicarboxylate-specific signal transduction histidine kinase
VHAIAAQPSGGELVLRVGLVEEGGRRTRVAIDVADAGPGIAPDVAAEIFEPFFTTKRDRVGTGLGLDIVSGIVGDAGGNVRLLPDAAPGAQFRVTLPQPDRALGAVRSVA